VGQSSLNVSSRLSDSAVADLNVTAHTSDSEGETHDDNKQALSLSEAEKAAQAVDLTDSSVKHDKYSPVDAFPEVNQPLNIEYDQQEGCSAQTPVIPIIREPDLVDDATLTETSHEKAEVEGERHTESPTADDVEQQGPRRLPQLPSARPGMIYLSTIVCVSQATSKEPI